MRRCPSPSIAGRLCNIITHYVTLLQPWGVVVYLLLSCNNELVITCYSVLLPCNNELIITCYCILLQVSMALYKNGVLLAAFWDKISIFHLGQTEHSSVIVHSALLAAIDVVLPSECQKPRWIDWTIEIVLSTCSVLLGRFPAGRSRFRVRHHAAYCARRSLTSYRPVEPTCSHFGARVRHRHMLLETARAPSQVQRSLMIWRRASPGQWVSLRAAGCSAQLAPIRFTSYGAD